MAAAADQTLQSGLIHLVWLVAHQDQELHSVRNPTLPLSHHLFWSSTNRFTKPSGSHWVNFSLGSQLRCQICIWPRWKRFQKTVSNTNLMPFASWGSISADFSQNTHKTNNKMCDNNNDKGCKMVAAPLLSGYAIIIYYFLTLLKRKSSMKHLCL